MDHLTNLVAGFMSVSTLIAILAILYVIVDWLIEKAHKSAEKEEGTPCKARRCPKEKPCTKGAGKGHYLLAAVLGTAAIACVMGAHKMSTTDGKTKRESRKKNNPFK